MPHFLCTKAFYVWHYYFQQVNIQNKSTIYQKTGFLYINAFF